MASRARYRTPHGLARALENLAKSIRSGRRTLLRFDTEWETTAIGDRLTRFWIDVSDKREPRRPHTRRKR